MKDNWKAILFVLFVLAIIYFTSQTAGPTFGPESHLDWITGVFS